MTYWRSLASSSPTDACAVAFVGTTSLQNNINSTGFEDKQIKEKALHTSEKFHPRPCPEHTFVQSPLPSRHTALLPSHFPTSKLAWFWTTPPSRESLTVLQSKEHPRNTSSTNLTQSAPTASRLRPSLIMSQPPLTPTLTPTFCFNTRFLRDFLRLSRSQIDDSISTSLNALVTPASSSPFDPNSTTVRTPSKALVRHPIPSSSYQEFASQVLFPSWQSRSDVLAYCTAVATSPDPNDPDLIEREAANQKDADRIVDERLDPYSGRFFPREARTEQLASLLRNETAVESIVRGRTWGIVSERCEGVEERWEDALDKWREGRRRG